MKGSFTVELSIIFPIIFVILVVLMQCGLYFSYRIYVTNAMNQSLMVCNQGRIDGLQPEAAMEEAESYLEGELQKIPIQVEVLEWKRTDGWLSEEYVVQVTARYSLVVSLSWSAVQKLEWMDPVEFRNRLDFIWEKGRQYLEWGETE